MFSTMRAEIKNLIISTQFIFDNMIFIMHLVTVKVYEQIGFDFSSFIKEINIINSILKGPKVNILHYKRT